MLLPRLSSLLGLVGLATVPLANAYDDSNIKSIPVRPLSSQAQEQKQGKKLT